MTKDRLQSLTYTELSRIAEQGNIHILQDMDKDALVSVIFEAFEEDRRDRLDSYNTAIQIEARKYSVSQDEELSLGFEDDIDLPERYHETLLVLMLRDPSWVFCYWDFEERILDELSENPQYEGLILRVSELASPDWSKDSLVDWFDIPIQFSDLSRYINLPSEDSYYGVEIFAQVGEKEVLVVRSNIIESSRDYLSSSGYNEQKDAEAQRRLLTLAGYSTDVGKFPGEDLYSADNPHRITWDSDGRGEY